MGYDPNAFYAPLVKMVLFIASFCGLILLTMMIAAAGKER